MGNSNNNSHPGFSSASSTSQYWIGRETRSNNANSTITIFNVVKVLKFAMVVGRMMVVDNTVVIIFIDKRNRRGDVL